MALTSSVVECLSCVWPRPRLQLVLGLRDPQRGFRLPKTQIEVVGTSCSMGTTEKQSIIQKLSFKAACVLFVIDVAGASKTTLTPNCVSSSACSSSAWRSAGQEGPRSTLPISLYLEVVLDSEELSISGWLWWRQGRATPTFSTCRGGNSQRNNFLLECCTIFFYVLLPNGMQIHFLY